jgi:hypothetical protein
MQAVIEAGRAIREKNNRPLKQPLRRVVVVHPDPDFLADITGGVLEQLVITCVTYVTFVIKWCSHCGVWWWCTQTLAFC